MHDDIKRFGLTGEITSDKFVSARESLIKEVEDEMREEGYVPVLDLIAQFTRSLDPLRGVFHFELSIYGVYVGEEESCRVAGITNGTRVQKSTHPLR